MEADVDTAGALAAGRGPLVVVGGGVVEVVGGAVEVVVVAAAEAFMKTTVIQSRFSDSRTAPIPT